MDRPRTRPAYPTLSPSHSSSAYTSSSSLESMPSPTQAPSSNPFAPGSAPLPSPTAEQRRYTWSLNQPQPQSQQPQQQQQQQQQPPYLTRSSTVPLQQALSAQMPGQQAQLQTAAPPQQQQASQQTRQSLDYQPDRRNAGTTNAQTMAMLADYNLLAEAAKRAQVACLIRDFDEMDMS